LISLKILFGDYL